MKKPSLLRKLIQKKKRVPYEKRSDLDELKFLFTSSIIGGVLMTGIVLGIMYLIGQSKPAYTYNEGKFELKFTEDVNRYVSNKDVTTYGINDVEPNKTGIEDLIGTYRKPLYKSIGSDGVKKLDRLNYMDVYAVNDDGNELNVLVSINQKVRLGYESTDKGTSTPVFVDMFEQEKDKFLMATAYTFRDSRSVHVQFGSMKKNEYNETVFTGTKDSEYVFHAKDLKRIKGWNTYTVEMLKGLNRL